MKSKALSMYQGSNSFAVASQLTLQASIRIPEASSSGTYDKSKWEGCHRERMKIAGIVYHEKRAVLSSHGNPRGNFLFILYKNDQDPSGQTSKKHLSSTINHGHACTYILGELLQNPTLYKDR